MSLETAVCGADNVAGTRPALARGRYAQDDSSEPWQVAFKEVHHFVYGVIDGCAMTLTAIELDGELFDESVIVGC